MTGHDLTTLAQKVADSAPLTDEERQLAAQLLRHADTAQAARSLARQAHGHVIMSAWPEDSDGEGGAPLAAFIGLDQPSTETWFLLRSALGETEVAPMSLVQQLAREVHAAWRDGMLNQRRTVAPDRMNWDTLSFDDQFLDAYIAGRVLRAVFTGLGEEAEAQP